MITRNSRMEFYINNTLVWTGVDTRLAGNTLGVQMARLYGGQDLMEVDYTYVTGGSPSPLFYDSFETGLGKWTTGAVSGDTIWVLDSSPYATTGNNAIWARDRDYATHYFIHMINGVSLPAGVSPLYLRFTHIFETELLYDGGLLEVSANNGGWGDTSGLSWSIGYPATLVSGTDTPLAGRQAFTGYKAGYTSSRVNLGPYAGSSVRMLFRFASDVSVNAGAYALGQGWTIDDVMIYTCSQRTVYLPTMVR